MTFKKTDDDWITRFRSYLDLNVNTDHVMDLHPETMAMAALYSARLTTVREWFTRIDADYVPGAQRWVRTAVAGWRSCGLQGLPPAIGDLSVLIPSENHPRRISDDCGHPAWLPVVTGKGLFSAYCLLCRKHMVGLKSNMDEDGYYGV